MFISELRNYAPHTSENDIINAWNAMLLDFPAGRIAFLLQLKNRYRTFLLSNTNAIHHQAFQQIQLTPAGTLDDCFEKAYYSHEMGLRKPDAEIFQYVLEENNLSAAETLFIDDTISNIEGAMLVNLNCVHLQPNQPIEQILSGY
jgi:putative hydrolase of the HAD superfamily